MKRQPVRILLTATIILLASNAQAITLGVSPATLEVKNTTRGGEYRTHLTASTADRNLLCTLSKSGDIADWIRFEDNTFVLDGQHDIPVYVSIPDSTPNGVYTGRIQLTTKPKSMAAGYTGMSLETSLSVKVSVEVLGTEGSWLRVLKTTVASAKEGQPIKSELTLKNNAATAAKPTVSFRALSRDKETTYSASVINSESVDPQSKKTFTTNLRSTGMAPGLYLMEMRVEMDEREYWNTMESFYIVSLDAKDDAVKVEGVLEDASVSATNMTLGETVTVYAKLTNTGDMPIDAKLRVEFIKDGKSTHIQETKNEYLEKGATKSTSLTYKPTETGEYKVRLWAEYAGVRTAVRETTIRVWNYTTPLFNFDINFYTIAAPAILLIVAWIVIYYRKYRPQD
ncbi:MAG: CARDB domain-containing protein [Candidatus Altiarchaeota archaeon]